MPSPKVTGHLHPANLWHRGENRSNCVVCIMNLSLFYVSYLFSAFWHRTKDGLLQRGVLKNLPDPCPATFDIYTPDDLTTCPQVLIVCRNPHSHSPPLPIKTPESVMGIFHALLLGLGWKLADATPRKIILDSGFMDSLRRAIDWNQQLDPTLADLHPSLANLDRVRRCITALRDEFFPSGTGFKGIVLPRLCRCSCHLLQY